MSKLTGKTAVITGAASGIGAATARLFYAQGANVVLADIDAQGGAHLAESLGQRALYIRTDVTAEDDHAAVVAGAVARFGGIDILFNNAGIANALAETPDVPIEDWQKILAVNLNAVFFACRHVIPVMKARGGAIVNTSSVAGLGGDAGCHAYSVTKAAVINYTRTLAIDHGKDGIRVNAVCPGPVETAMTAGLFAFPPLVELTNRTVPMGRYAQPEEIARAVLFLASDDASFISGAVLPVDGGLSAGSGNPNMFAALAALAA